MEKWTDKYICGKCKAGIVEVLHTSTTGQGSVKVKPCNKCKHHYYIKQLRDLKEAIIN